MPRIRDITAKCAQALLSYRAFHNERIEEDGLMRTLFFGIGQRNFKSVTAAHADPFVLSPSSVGRTFWQRAAEVLEDFCAGPLNDYDLVGMFIDGTQGPVPAAKRSSAAWCRCSTAAGTSVNTSWPTQEARVSGAPATSMSESRLQRGLGTASIDTRPTSVLRNNTRPPRSLEEGMEDTGTIQWLGIAAELGQTLRTTNCIEHLNSTLDKWTRKVCYRKNSAPVRHWVALALMHANPT